MKINPIPQGLDRFVEAQDRVYDSVCDELALGEKTTHWMWFVFPQLKALGRSAMANCFGIGSLEEASAYWQHPILGNRLRECTQLLLKQPNADAFEIFGSPDDMKLRSCLTLFRAVAPDELVFQQALERFFHGKPDEATLDLLNKNFQNPDLGNASEGGLDVPYDE
jgi:uncharacterized protein (DUF1810 family)